jgi:hypothetical protein
MTDKKKPSPEVEIVNRVFKQASGRLRRIAAKRTEADVKAAWLAAAEALIAAAKKGGSK